MSLLPFGSAPTPIFTSTKKGSVPASGGGTTNFLRADGTWEPPTTYVPGPGDLNPTTFTGADNQASPANITGLVFTNPAVSSFEAMVSVIRNTTFAQFKLNGVWTGSNWEMSDSFVGSASTGITFSINSSGQVLYTSTSTGTAPTIKYRAFTL